MTVENSSEQFTPRTNDEADFLAKMLAYRRRVGAAMADQLLAEMRAATDEGMYRGDLVKMIDRALAALPTVH